MTGHQLREHRTEMGRRQGRPLSARDFCRLLDVPYSTYRRWESQATLPRHAAALVRAYLILARQTMGWTPPPHKETP